MERTNSTLRSGYYTAYHDGIVWPVFTTQCQPLGEWRRSTWFLHGAFGQPRLKAFLHHASFSEDMQSQMSGQDLNGSWFVFGFSFGYSWLALTMHHVLNTNYGMCSGSNTSVLYTRSAMLLLSGLQRPCVFVSLWLPPKAANVGISEFLWIYLQCPNYIVFTNKLVLLSQEILETFGHLLCRRIPCWPISELSQLYEEHRKDKSANLPSQSSGASFLSIVFFNVIKQRINSGPMRIHY